VMWEAHLWPNAPEDANRLLVSYKVPVYLEMMVQFVCLPFTVESFKMKTVDTS